MYRHLVRERLRATHVQTAAEAARLIDDEPGGMLHSVRPIVRHHHERLDGSGYPDGLRGDDVPVLAQIVSTVDLFEAITMGREYLAPRSADDAIAVLRHETTLGWRRPDVAGAVHHARAERRATIAPCR